MAEKLRFLAVTALACALAAGCDSAPRTGVARGKQLYGNCQPCHGADGAGLASVQAPAIAGLPEWYVDEQLAKFRNGVRGAHPQDTEGHRMRPMARTLKTPEDVSAVAAYVATFPPARPRPTLAGGDAAAGSALYRGVCAVCHGADGRGNDQMRAPTLVAQSDWYVLSQLEKFRNGLRGAHPEDVMGSQMRAMAMTLADRQAMLDVVAYIRTLAE